MVGEGVVDPIHLDTEAVAALIEASNTSGAEEDSDLEVAIRLLHDAEDRCHLVTPRGSDRVKTVLSGLVLYLKNQFVEDDQLTDEAYLVAGRVNNEHNAGGTLACLGVVLAEQDMPEQATSVAQAQEVNDTRFAGAVHLAIAEAYARRGAEEKVLDHLHQAYIARPLKEDDLPVINRVMHELTNSKLKQVTT